MESFLEVLDKELGNMDGVSRGEIIGDFEEHFRLARAEGKTDGQIIEALGEPKAIAEQFFETGGKKTALADDAAFRSGRPAVAGHGGGAPGDFEFSAEGVERLRVDVNAANIRVGQSPRAQSIKVGIRAFDGDRGIAASRVGGSLEIMEPAPRGFLNFLNIHKKPSEIDITLPQGMGLRQEISARSGSANIVNCAGDRLSVNVPLGNVVLENARFDRVEARLKAGDVKFEGVKAGKMDIVSSAGNVKLDGCSGPLEARSSAGNVKITKHSGDINVKGSAGNVNVKESTGSIEAYASAGNVKLESVSGGYIEAGSSAGNAEVDAREAQGLKVSASVGNAKARVGKITGDAEISAGTGEARFEADCVRGNINARAGTGTVEVALPKDAQMRIVAKKGMGSVQCKLESFEQSPYTLTASSSLGTVRVVGK